MNCNELMIGDWVKLMNPIGEWITNVQIDSNLFIPFLQYGEDGFAKFEPIPLTAEILEKNGWFHDGMFMEKIADEKIQFGWTDSCVAVLYKNGYSMCDCKNVHELQHSLRLCGFNDLADNFKV